MRVIFACCGFMCILVLVCCESNDTTTAKPSTTTGKPSNVTTHKPDTTTGQPITTTPMPTPPKPESAPVMNYTIITKDEKGKDIICLMAEFSAKFELTYNNTKGVMETGYLSMTNMSVVNKGKSKCDKETIVLVIDINDVPSDTLSFTVMKKDNKYFVKEVILSVQTQSIKHSIPLAPEQAIIDANMDNKTLFEAPMGKSYTCKSADDMSMTGGGKFEVKMDVSEVRFDAFRTEEGNSFRDGQLCAKDEEFSDIIPIAVGAALAALVVIVLIAYFIGRRRSRRLAYQSV